MLLVTFFVHVLANNLIKQSSSIEGFSTELGHTCSSWGDSLIPNGIPLKVTRWSCNRVSGGNMQEGSVCCVFAAYISSNLKKCFHYHTELSQRFCCYLHNIVISIVPRASRAGGCFAGWTAKPNGYCYKMYTSPKKTWSQASSQCASKWERFIQNLPFLHNHVILT